LRDIDNILKKDELTKEDLIFLMKLDKKLELEKLFKKALEIKLKYIGNKVYYRGLIEISNKCIKNCLYCGIRRDNHKIDIFQMSKEEILSSARWIYENGFGSIALQGGERQDKEFIEFIDEIIIEIKRLSKNKLGITLSLGEQSYEVYKRWFQLGAHRYLLRIESSSEEIYNSLHPEDKLHDHKMRIRCLRDLREVGYQVGTGVMIGLPNQTEEDLVNDILFYKNMDIDMIGMGPYIPHQDTPMGNTSKGKIPSEKKRVELSLKMIALTRIYLKDLNIAATTALQGLDPMGREKGILAGANILMPTATQLNHREKYQLYKDKPGINDNAFETKQLMDKLVKDINHEIVYNKWGDSPHFHKKNK
jgi:biotin synthase